MTCKYEVVAYFETYSRNFTGRIEEKYENLKIGGLRAENWTQYLHYMKQRCYPLDRDGERIIFATDLPNKALRKEVVMINTKLLYDEMKISQL